MKKIQIKSKIKGNHVILIDDSDFDLFNQYSWYVSLHCNSWYAVTTVDKNNSPSGKKHIYLHRLLLGFPKNKTVDHKDGNGLNNCRHNIRVASFSQNNANLPIRIDNTSGFKGVSFQKNISKFYAYINKDGKRTPLGYHDHAVDAAKAYNEAAKKYFGEFALLNKIPKHI
jgi:hypothetical protein